MLIIYNKAYAKQGLVFSFMKEKCLQLIPKHSICKGSDVVFSSYFAHNKCKPCFKLCQNKWASCNCKKHVRLFRSSSK